MNELLRVIAAGVRGTDPKLFLAQYNMAQHRDDDARALFDELIRTEDNGRALFLVGGLEGQKGNEEIALAKLAESNNDAEGAAQHMKAAAERYAVAKGYFKRAITRDWRPGSWEPAMNLSRVLREEARNSKDPTEQRKLLEEALEEVRYAQFHFPHARDPETGLEVLTPELAMLEALLASLDVSGPQPAR